MSRRNTADDFWRRVDKDSEGNGCWLWRGYVLPRGYGRFHVAGRLVYAHRFAYELEHGLVPQGFELDHLCRSKACVNPEHLEVVSHRGNLLRGEGWSGRKARQTACVHGHSLDGLRRRAGKVVGRYCRTCATEYRKSEKFQAYLREYRKRRWFKEKDSRERKDKFNAYQREWTKRPKVRKRIAQYLSLIHI